MHSYFTELFLLFLEVQDTKQNSDRRGKHTEYRTIGKSQARCSRKKSIKFSCEERGQVGDWRQITDELICHISSTLSVHLCCLVHFLLVFFFHSDCEVFPKNHAAPFSKVLTFFRKESFTLDAYYNNPKELPCPNTSIGTVQGRREDSNERGMNPRLFVLTEEKGWLTKSFWNLLYLLI